MTGVNTTANDKIWLLTFDKTRPKIWCCKMKWFKFSCGSSDHDGHDDRNNHDQDDDLFLKVFIQWARQALQCVLGTSGQRWDRWWQKEIDQLRNKLLSFIHQFINWYSGAREGNHRKVFFRSHKLAATSGNDTLILLLLVEKSFWLAGGGFDLTTQGNIDTCYAFCTPYHPSRNLKSPT